jgi:nucleoside-diphosphate-sugar epimerase
MIHATDAVAPRPADVYARSKLAAEERIRASGVPWSILRLSFVLDLDSLRMDPLMFAMPLNTSIEVVAVEDVAAAFASAVDSPAAVGACLHIAGGPACRTTYRAFLRRALACYGFGRRGLPEAAFGTGDFHCGFMDTVESQRLLHYQHATLNELYARMARRRLPLRFLLTPVRPISRAWLLQRSPYYRPARRHIGLRRNAPRLRHGGA